MNKLSDLTILKQLLKEKQNKLSTLKYEYEAIVEQEPYMRNRLKNRQYSIHKLAGEIKSIEKEIKTMELKHIQDSMEILRLSGFITDSDPKSYLNKKVWVRHEANGQIYKGLVTREAGDKIHIVLPATGQTAWKSKNEVELVKDSDCGEKIYTKGAEDQCKDDDATEMGTFEQLGQNHETEAMELEKNPVQAQDDDEVGEKFKTVMKEFGKGELESSSGETVTDPEQAKAIAYSEQREATKDASDRRGIQLKVGDLVAVHGKVGKITRILRAKDERDDVVEVFFDNSGTYSPDRTDRYYANETTKDSDPKVAEAKKLIDLFGGAM